MRFLTAAAIATLAFVQPALARDVTGKVTAIVEHPALDAVRDGVKDALAAGGFKVGENLTFNYESVPGLQIGRAHV